MWAKMWRFKNKTLIKINYSYLLITLGLVHVNDIVVSIYEIHYIDAYCTSQWLVHIKDIVVGTDEIHSMLIAYYGLVHDDCTICTLHVTGVGTW